MEIDNTTARCLNTLGLPTVADVSQADPWWQIGPIFRKEDSWAGLTAKPRW